MQERMHAGVQLDAFLQNEHIHATGTDLKKKKKKITPILEAYFALSKP